MEAAEWGLRRDLQQKGEDVERALCHTKQQLAHSEHGNQQWRTNVDAAVTTIDEMKAQMHQEQNFYNQREHMMTCETQAEIASRPTLSQTDQQWTVRLQVAEQHSADIKLTMLNMEQ